MAIVVGDRTSIGELLKPTTYGSWYDLDDHIGRVKYTVTASPVGSTTLYGQARYFSSSWQYAHFSSMTIFTTGNVVAAVDARFYGLPYGSAVTGSVCSEAP